LVKPLLYIPLQKEHTQNIISQSSSLMKIILPWYLGGLIKKKQPQQTAENQKHLWEDIHRARSFKSPVSPHHLSQEWFSYKPRRPCQSERQTQIPGPRLPTSSNDYIKRSTLSQVNRKRRAKMQREEPGYLKLGRQKGKQKNRPLCPPPKNGGEEGRGGKEKTKSATT